MLRATLAAAAGAALMAMPASAQNSDPTQVMVLGTYHFDNPGLDMINIAADDVLQPRRQAELEALADALATWKPDRILVEAQPDTADLHMGSFRADPAKRIAEDRSEHYQIGYRLALKLGHSDVFGFDERSGDGEPDYFPMESVQRWAAENGKADQFGALVSRVQAIVEEASKDNDRCSIARNLAQQNDPAALKRAHGLFYYGVLGFGDADNQPGAELNAYWYMRNAKMFSKIDLIAEPGDRVLVIVGAGHKYWLDHLVELSEGYELADPVPYLQQADDGRCG